MARQPNLHFGQNGAIGGIIIYDQDGQTVQL
jgi:hypothetical protein